MTTTKNEALNPQALRTMAWVLCKAAESACDLRDVVEMGTNNESLAQAMPADSRIAVLKAIDLYEWFMGAYESLMEAAEKAEGVICPADRR